MDAVKEDWLKFKPDKTDRLIIKESLSVHFTVILPGGPGFSWYQNVSIVDFIGAKNDGYGGGNWSYKTCEAPVKSSSPTNEHWPDALPVAQLTQCQSTEWKRLGVCGNGKFSVKIG